MGGTLCAGDRSRSRHTAPSDADMEITVLEDLRVFDTGVAAIREASAL